MRYSQLFAKTLRRPPREAKIASHQLLIKGGLIDRALSSGIYSFLPLGWRVMKKIEKVIREEMNAIGGQELFLPSLHPRELWEETGRWQNYVPPLLKLKDQHGHGFCLAPTHEEVIADLCRRFVHSYRDLPSAVYQIQNKFRNETRATGGLLRVREFIMKDLYSFHQDEKDLDKYYQKVYQAYEKIFERCGLKAEAVEAFSGSIGGSFNHEFMLFSSSGEDKVAVCDKCDYKANLEKGEFTRRDINSKDKLLPLKDVYQPKEIDTIEQMAKFFKLPKERMLKDVLYKGSDGRYHVVIIRGDLAVNETKLAAALGIDSVSSGTEVDLKKLGTERGSVPVKGLKGAHFIGDLSLKTVKNFVGGYKRASKELEWENTNLNRDFKVGKLIDVAEVYDGAVCARCGAKLKLKSAIELGHVFKLGTKYSKQMGAKYLDKKGKKQLVWMGCYGIGLGRLMAAIVEAYHDKKGIVWPESVAPFQAHLLAIGKTKKTASQADDVYQKLKDVGVDVLYDDRQDVSAGVKFADADLLGVPIRLVVSEKTGKKVEWKKRDNQKTELLNPQEAIRRLGKNL